MRPLIRPTRCTESGRAGRDIDVQRGASTSGAGGHADTMRLAGRGLARAPVGSTRGDTRAQGGIRSRALVDEPGDDGLNTIEG